MELAVNIPESIFRVIFRCFFYAYFFFREEEEQMAIYIKQETEAAELEKAMKERIIKRRKELDNAKKAEEQVCAFFGFFLLNFQNECLEKNLAKN